MGCHVLPMGQSKASCNHIEALSTWALAIATRDSCLFFVSMATFDFDDLDVAESNSLYGGALRASRRPPPGFEPTPRVIGDHAAIEGAGGADEDDEDEENPHGGM